jgi:hypothetical protein
LRILAVALPAIWERYRRRPASTLLAHGCLKRQGQVIHVLVSKLEDVAPPHRQPRQPVARFPLITSACRRHVTCGKMLNR